MINRARGGLRPSLPSPWRETERQVGTARPTRSTETDSIPQEYGQRRTQARSASRSRAGGRERRLLEGAKATRPYRRPSNRTRTTDRGPQVPKLVRGDGVPTDEREGPDGQPKPTSTRRTSKASSTRTCSRTSASSPPTQRLRDEVRETTGSREVLLRLRARPSRARRSSSGTGFGPPDRIQTPRVDPCSSRATSVFYRTTSLGEWAQAGPVRHPPYRERPDHGIEGEQQEKTRSSSDPPEVSTRRRSRQVSANFSRRITLRGRRSRRALTLSLARSPSPRIEPRPPGRPDTGRARSNRITATAPPPPPAIQRLSPARQAAPKPPTLRPLSTKPIGHSRVRFGEEIHITNNLPYIQQRTGYSAQAPANFKQGAREPSRPYSWEGHSDGDRGAGKGPRSTTDIIITERGWRAFSETRRTWASPGEEQADGRLPREHTPPPGRVHRANWHRQDTYTNLQNRLRATA